MVFFYGLARVFAFRFGLLPTSERFARMQSRITVDNACIAGGLLLLIALLATLWSVSFWARAGFGDLVASQIVRPAALAVVTASIGVQTITFGFLWGILNQRLPALGLAPSEGVAMPGSQTADRSDPDAGQNSDTVA